MAERRALVRNAADAKQVRRGAESQKHREERERNETQQAALHQPSYRLLWWVLEICGTEHTSIARDAEGRVDTHQMAINEGARNVGLQIKARLLLADPDAFSRMQKDAADMESKIIEPAPRTETVEEEDDGN